MLGRTTFFTHLRTQFSLSWHYLRYIFLKLRVYLQFGVLSEILSLPNKQIKVHPRTGHESPGVGRSMYDKLSLTSALEWGGWSTLRHYVPATLPPVKTRYLLYMRLGGPQSRFGRVRKISPLDRTTPHKKLKIILHVDIHVPPSTF